MSGALLMQDNKVATIFTEDDFRYLIENYMGQDSARYFEELLNTKDVELQYYKHLYESNLE